MHDRRTTLLERGVYRAPCLDPDGCVIVYAVDHNHCHLRYEDGGVRSVPLGDNPLAVADEVWDVLNRLDPIIPAAAADVA
jgi:hypothetical protein